MALLLNRPLMIQKLFYNEYLPLNSYFAGSIYENPNNPKNEYNPERGLKLLQDEEICKADERDFAWGFYRKLCTTELGQLKGQAITGRYDFTAGPVPHVSQVPELLAQWRPSGSGYGLVVINDSMIPAVPAAGSLRLL